jgi:hypothetical protein
MIKFAPCTVFLVRRSQSASSHLEPPLVVFAVDRLLNPNLGFSSMVLFASENEEVHMLNASVPFWVEELDIHLE